MRFVSTTNSWKNEIGWRPGCWPKLMRKGVSLVDPCTISLMANSHIASRELQLFCRWLAKHRSISPTTRFILSVCPSVSGWLLVLNFSCVPNWPKTSLKKAAVNLGSLSHIMDLLIPWRRKGSVCRAQQHPWHQWTDMWGPNAHTWTGDPRKYKLNHTPLEI